jgi:hypothetical protein
MAGRRGARTIVEEEKRPAAAMHAATNIYKDGAEHETPGPARSRAPQPPCSPQQEARHDESGGTGAEAVGPEPGRNPQPVVRRLPCLRSREVELRLGVQCPDPRRVIREERGSDEQAHGSQDAHQGDEEPQYSRAPHRCGELRGAIVPPRAFG